MSILNYLKKTIDNKGAAYIVLIDPDKKNNQSIEKIVNLGNNSGVDAFFIGGSLIMDSEYNRRVRDIKNKSKIPIILFPGGVNQINPYFDAMLYTSIISGRNPHYLIGEQVIAAPIVKDLEIETIPTGYILIDGGSVSMVQVMSGTIPLPMQKIDAIIAHALAGQYLGKKMIYLEAGSGAKYPVENNIIKAVKDVLNIPLIIGGGLSNPEIVNEKVIAGASVIVTGTIIETESTIINEIADAVHWKMK